MLGTTMDCPWLALKMAVFCSPEMGYSLRPTFQSLLPIPSQRGLFFPPPLSSLPLPVNEMTKRVFQGVAEGKVFIVDTRERTARSMWESPEQGEKVVN